MTKTPARRGRPPGRPPLQADGPDQRERLIGIALELFARNGYAETTLAAIAREAGMTPAAVHYYFRTREQLFETIFDERILPMRARVDAIFQEHADDPVAAFTRLAERFVEVAVEQPWIGPVLFTELLSGNDLFKQHMRERTDPERFATLLAAIRRWQHEGRLNPDLDPALLMTTIPSLTFLPMAGLRKWADDPARRHIDAGVVARHAVALLSQGLPPAGA